VLGCGVIATYKCDPLDQRWCALQTADRALPPTVAPPAQPARPVPRAPTPAQLADADRWFEAGRALAKAQRFAEACEQFARSDAIERTFGTALNLGDCAVRDGHLDQAWRRYDDAGRLADTAGAASLAKFAHEQAAALTPRLCAIIVTLADPIIAGTTVRVGDRELPAAAKLRWLVEPREIDIAITVPGSPVLHWQFHGKAGETKVISVPAQPPAVTVEDVTAP